MMLISNPVTSSELAFPILECFHIAGFIVAIGATAIVDFQILGFGLSEPRPSQLAKGLRFWMLGGLIVAILSGMALYSSDPDMYYTNSSFLIKMACLIAALVFNYTIHRKVVRQDAVSGGAKVAACVSLTLWASIVFGGIFIAFIPGGF